MSQPWTMTASACGAPEAIDQALTEMLTARRPVYIEVINSAWALVCPAPDGELKARPCASDAASLAQAVADDSELGTCGVDDFSRRVDGVARLGGLADTVIDANEAATAAGVATGVQFYPPSIESLTYALNRAFDISRDPAVLRRLRLNGMRADVSWRGPAKRYAALYRDIVRPAE